MASSTAFFNHTLEQSRERLISHLADFLYVFPLYAHGERAGEIAAEAGAEMLVHAAVVNGDLENEERTSHLFLAANSILAFTDPAIFATSLVDGESAFETKQWLSDFAGLIEAVEPLPREDPILSAPTSSFEFLDCAALGALHKSLEALPTDPIEEEATTQTALGVVLLEVAIAYDLHMGHLDHALAVWGALAILASIDIPLPASARIPHQYRRMLVTYLHSLADNYGLTKDFSFLFKS